MDDDEKLSMYLQLGAVELTGMDEHGEFIFQITEKANNIIFNLKITYYLNVLFCYE